MMNRVLLIIWLLAITASELFSQGDLILHFSVEAGKFQRINTPVSISQEGNAISDTLNYRLYEKVKGKMIEKRLQADPGYETRLWWILDGVTEAGSSREFYLYSSPDTGTSKSEISAAATPKEIVLRKDNSEILRYRTALLYPPEGVDTIYKRNGFIHPLFSPSGNILTRVSPPDHYHHVGIWNPWTKVRSGGHVTDFWNLQERQGTVRFAGINNLESGPVFGGFSVKQEHIDFQGTNHNELTLNEVWDIRAWNAEALTGTKSYLVDLTSFLSVATGLPVVLEAYRYGGGIGIRATAQWNKDNSYVLTSEGKTRKDADGTRARWTDIGGRFENESTSGVTFFSHPSNREYPEPMRVWPENMNGRGDLFFEFCPIRLKEWELLPGKVYRLKYRILVYDGRIDNKTAERVWSDFAFPPVITILK